MPDVLVSIDGVVPVPWGANEWAWRAEVARAARVATPSGTQIEVLPHVRFTARLHFRLPPLQAGRADLHNLAKPVLDTLFQVRNPQVRDLTLTGALFNVDDDRVYSLHLTKSEVPGPLESGLTASISW